MLSKNDKERTKLLVVTDAEMRSSNKLDVIQVAHRYIYNYLRTKAPDIPNDIFTRDSFDSESGIISAEYIRQDDFEMWAGRLSEPDSTVPGRSWHLELTTGKISSGYRFGSRLSCFSRNLDFEFDPAVPRVYRQLASQGILYGDGVKLTASPIDIEAEAERDQERGRSAAMSARIRALEEQLRSAKDGLHISNRPNNYQEIGSWVQSEFAGRIQLCGKAMRGLREAKYENVDLVCDLIELLATSYVDSKRGTESAWHRFEDEIARWGVEFSKSISETRAGEQGDEYFVPYRGRKRFLEWHLKKGNSRDPRRDLRIYFFWDEEDEELVLGYLTGHLDNRLT